MKKAKRPRPPHTGRFVLLLSGLCLLTFAVSALTTSRILSRVGIVEVPDLTGKSVESARSLLRVARLSLDIVEFRFDQRLAANLIISQDPRADSSVRSGRIVRVVVSRGSQAKKLPDLTGMNLREATLELGKHGFNPGRISHLFSNEAPKSSVIAQWPAVGEYASQNSRINLLVSAGPRPVKWIMPDIRGAALEEAMRVLKHLGLEPQNIRQQVNDLQDPNTILSQQPAAGDVVQGGDFFSLVVARRSTDRVPTGRFVAIPFRIPDGDAEVRVKMSIQDDRGRREIYNSMERPNAEITVRTTVQGVRAVLSVFINNTLVEERNL